MNTNDETVSITLGETTTSEPTDCLRVRYERATFGGIPVLVTTDLADELRHHRATCRFGTSNEPTGAANERDLP